MRNTPPFHTGHGGTTKEDLMTRMSLGNCWYGTHKVNLGLKIDLLTDATQEEKNIIAGQLYFFRAFFHFQIMQYWGGIHTSFS